MIAYCILKDGTPYQELGDDYFDNLNPERTVKRLVKRLERLGMNVNVTPAARLTPGFQES